MMETWKDVVGCEEYYQISNLGRVKSKDRSVKRGKNDKGIYVMPSKLLKQQKNNRGYIYFQIKAKGENHKMFIHRAVALAFIPNTLNKPFINHKDSNPLNNKLWNLEWITNYENIHHAIDKGRFNNSFANTNLKFKASRDKVQRPVIGTNVKTGETIKFNTINEAGRFFNNRAGDICKCCKGQRGTAQGYKWEYDTQQPTAKKQND